jgi:hypothetical protein
LFRHQPASAGPGVVDVQVIVGGVLSLTPADQFTVANRRPARRSCRASIQRCLRRRHDRDHHRQQPHRGFVTFGVTPAISVNCTADGLSCTATSPAAQR